MVTLPTQLTSQLDAVNVLLACIAEAPINSLEPPIEAVDAANALQTLNEFDLATQLRGWWFNREYRLKLSPNQSGNIQIPAQSLLITKARWSNSSATPCKVVERAKMLYDPINHTNVFTQPVCVDAVVRVGWDDMPEVARRYITISAARAFQARNQGSAGVDAVTKDEVDRAQAILEQHEDANERNNQITGNASVGRLIVGNGVRRRNS